MINVTVAFLSFLREFLYFIFFSHVDVIYLLYSTVPVTLAKKQASTPSVCKL